MKLLSSAKENALFKELANMNEGTSDSDRERVIEQTITYKLLLCSNLFHDNPMPKEKVQIIMKEVSEYPSRLSFGFCDYIFPQ